MCSVIIINKGEKEIRTPREFLEHFGFEAPMEEDYDEVVLDSCLCQVDVEKALIDNKISFRREWGDYYVGMLNEIIFD